MVLQMAWSTHHLSTSSKYRNIAGEEFVYFKFLVAWDKVRRGEEDSHVFEEIVSFAANSLLNHVVV